MSSTAYAQEVLAKITRPSLVVFPSFHRGLVVPYRHQIGTPYSVGIDPGYSKPHVVFIAHLRDLGEPDRDVVFDEIFEREVPEASMIQLLADKFRKLGRSPELIASD